MSFLQAVSLNGPHLWVDPLQEFSCSALHRHCRKKWWCNIKFPVFFLL